MIPLQSAKYDVVVVGAGPAGSAAAGACAAAGLRTLCIEEHGTIGYPVQCAGLLSNAAFTECRVSGRAVQNKVSGARVISGKGSRILIDAKKTMAFVVDRGTLDREMAEHAAGAGAEYLLHTAVCGLGINAVTTRGPSGSAEIGYKVLIAADGPRSSVARMLGMERPPVFLAGIQADVPQEIDPRFVEVYPDASPDFFGWAIPAGPDRTRIGLCSRTNVPALFAEFRKMFSPSTVHLVTGTIPLGIMPRTYGHRTLITGDAAGFAKPTSGGGVYTGIRSARHAAAVAIAACEHDRYDDEFLSRYERLWNEDFGNELSLGFRLFGMRERLSPDDMDELVRALDDPGLIRTIEEYGDMDRPSAVVKRLLLNPATLRLLGPLARTGFKALF
ncbi:NAD(P)/FAD-dependent oxidoreductase [Methanoregula sp.]|uniref:geranylgeranyl reductase family protein n=1 Tax=Methanoregula sp. TaxID=2052170 RepID=UPI00260D4737|nr:NAD(P)/FAD-dependent oxidoreductase [Methanoregula sp.]MDD5141987.1 NAD(P)/FAD-dependent oxidoreductase [Methanoregula sp.]